MNRLAVPTPGIGTRSRSIMEIEGNVMAAGKSSRVNRKYKTEYTVRNWREYERGLRSRGDVTIWLSEEAIAAWTPVVRQNLVAV